jgi:hypothetical protein
MSNDSFVLDKENLLKACKIPLIVSVVLGLTFLLKIYLGYLYGLAVTVLAAYAGAAYMKSVMDSGKIPLITNAGLNGAILGGVAILTYGLVSQISSSIISQDWSINLMSLLFSSLEGAFIGLLGALAWYTYKINTN